MMTRCTIVVLLSAVLLGCPFVCLSEAVESPCAEVGCCDCQDQASTGDTDPTPERPDEEESDCLCDGAIAGVDRTSVVSDLQDEMRFVGEIDASLAVACSGMNRVGESWSLGASHFPLQSCGRDICALINARLL